MDQCNKKQAIELQQKDEEIYALIKENQQLKKNLQLSENKNVELEECLNYTADQLNQSEKSCLDSLQLPYRLGSEVLSQAKKHAASANKINFTILKDYTHNGFLVKECEIGAPELEILRLLEQIHSAIDAESQIELNKRLTVEEKQVQNLKKAKSKAVIFASLMSYANPDFIWDYATIEAVIVKSHSPSRLILDIISNITPGQSTQGYL